MKNRWTWLCGVIVGVSVLARIGAAPSRSENPASPHGPAATPVPLPSGDPAPIPRAGVQSNREEARHRLTAEASRGGERWEEQRRRILEQIRESMEEHRRRLSEAGIDPDRPPPPLAPAPRLGPLVRPTNESR